MQISIIERWAKLPEDSYFTKDLAYGTRQERCELSEVFQRSAVLLTPDCPYDKELWLCAAKNASLRYEKAFSKKSLIIRATSLFHGMFSTSLYARYEAFMNTMAWLAAQAYKGRLLGLKEAYSEEVICAYKKREPTVLRQAFLIRVLDIAMMNIWDEGGKEYKGFFYELRREQKSICYVIGTCHVLPKCALADQRIAKIFEKIHELFVESSDAYRRASFFVSLMTLGRGTSLDVRLISLAEQKGIKIHDLDRISTLPAIRKTWMESALMPIRVLYEKEQDTCSQDVRRWREWSVNCEMVKGHIGRFRRIVMQVGAIFREKSLRYFEIMEHFLTGNEAGIKIVSQSAMTSAAYNQLVKQRNARWLEEDLLPRLQQDNPPFCIAVGAAHLFGECGLLPAFERNGLEVRRLHSVADIQSLTTFTAL